MNDAGFLKDPPDEAELELNYIEGLRTLLGWLSAEEVARFKLALELKLVQPVEGDDNLLIIPEIRSTGEGATEFLQRTRQVPTLKRYLEHLRIKLLEPSQVKHRGNLLGKTGPLAGHAVFIEKADLLRILRILELSEENVISAETFEPNFPEIEVTRQDINPETVLDDAMNSITLLVNGGRESSGSIPRDVFIKRLNQIVNVDLIGVFTDNPKLLEKFLVFLIKNQILRVRNEEVRRHSENCINISKKQGDTGVDDIFVLYIGGGTPLFAKVMMKTTASKSDTATLDVREFFTAEQMAQHLIGVLESGSFINFSLNEAFNPLEA